MNCHRNNKLVALLLLCCLYIQTDIYIEEYKEKKRSKGNINNTSVADRSKTQQNLNKTLLMPVQTVKNYKIDEEENVSLPSEIKERLQRRLRRMQDKCRSGSLTSEEDLSYTITQRYYLFHEQNAAVCLIAKAGSSSWRYHLRQVNSGPPATVEIVHDSRRQVFLNRTEEKILKDIGSHISILTVRHPLTRLVSAWKNKYHEGNGLKKYDAKKEAKVAKIIFTPSWLYNVQTFWVPAMATNGLIPSNMHTKLGLATPLNPNQEYPRWVYISLQRILKPSIDFTQFLKHVVNTFNSSSEDPHWNVFSHECSPCSLHYDYIAKVETFSEDLEYIFKHIGIPSDPNIQKNKIKKKNDNPYAYISYYTKIPLDLRKSLYMIYRKDMDMFGYNLPDWFLSEKAH